MKPETRHRLSMLPYAVALLPAVALGVAAFNRVPEPVARYSTWCPRPEDRTPMQCEAPPMSEPEIINRLRLVRIKLNTLADHGRLGSGDEAEAVDAMLLELISDIQLSATPPEGPRP